MLHAGCGNEPLPPYFGQCDELRLDIAAHVDTQVVADICDLPDIGTFDVVYCCHVIEHLTVKGCWKALKEFQRVLKPGGYLVTLVPDLQDVKPTLDVLYQSDAGPVTGRDMYWGMASMVEDYPHMAHRNGFTKGLLTEALEATGYRNVLVNRLSYFQLMGVGIK